jgi:hypothetical protein
LFWLFSKVIIIEDIINWIPLPLLCCTAQLLYRDVMLSDQNAKQKKSF